VSEHLPMERFDRNALDALAMPGQRAALRAATELFGERRAAALQRAPAFDAWRDHARAVKDHVLANLHRYLEQFEAAATARGTRVHWAADAAMACDIVAGIARAAGARTVVKSKSMTTEEIGLNDALAAAGIDAVETDLGEWIVQLAREVPFHIVVPAIHKTRAQIGTILHAATGVAADADARELTRAARAALRERFRTAAVGVTGANFAVAATGSILILENEGNARMCTTLPRVHVAVVGIEKLVPRLQDLAVFLRLLPRSGTGQDLTTYQSILTGPRPASASEGPTELHVVLLDNGRTRMLPQRVTRQALACIRCGACLNACPVYQQVGGHAYGSVYPGPIGAVITPQLVDLGRARQLPFASSLCGACRDVCPVRIDIPELLLHLRAEVTQAGGAVPGGARRRLQALAFAAFAFAMAGPRRYRVATALVRAADRWLPWLVRRLPPLSHWHRGRELPRLARRPFRALWQERP